MKVGYVPVRVCGCGKCFASRPSASTDAFATGGVLGGECEGFGSIGQCRHVPWLVMSNRARTGRLTTALGPVAG